MGSRLMVSRNGFRKRKMSALLGLLFLTYAVQDDKLFLLSLLEKPFQVLHIWLFAQCPLCNPGLRLGLAERGPARINGVLHGPLLQIMRCCLRVERLQLGLVGLKI